MITAAQADAEDDSAFIEGPPLMIAEVLSPYDTQREITERVAEYLDCGVPVVWIANPDFQTITVHRPGASPIALDSSDVLAGDPELPGFTCPVADFFR